MKKIMLLGLFVIMSLFLMSCVPRPGVAPISGQATAAVVATSCNGDSNCEMINAQAEQVTSSGSITAVDKVIASGAVVSGDTHTNSLLVDTDATVSRDLTVGRNENVVGKSTLNSIEMDSYSGDYIKSATDATGKFSRLVFNGTTMSRGIIGISSGGASRPRIDVNGELVINNILEVENGFISGSAPNFYFDKKTIAGSATGRIYFGKPALGMSLNMDPLVIEGNSNNYDSSLILSGSNNGVVRMNGTSSTFTSPIARHMTVTVNTSLQLNHLTGTGNAYACLDSTGILYRSATPCS